jgi:hypothetical protein
MSCGKPRYTSWVNRVDFERNAEVWAPDVVVYYEGINDNIYNSFPWLEGAPTVGYFDARSLHSSVFLDLFRYHVVDKALRSVPDFESRPLRSPAIYEEGVMRHFWGNIPSTVAGVRAHNQVVEALANELGLSLARVAEAIPRDAAHFGDICHLRPVGNVILGRVIAAAVPVRD